MPVENHCFSVTVDYDSNKMLMSLESVNQVFENMRSRLYCV
ncbi:MAG: hypothetical protein RMY16_11810 [Nostoc sp. DedQUE12b]|nr:MULTISPECIES: hypothetical protein [unclassified Nostoc]MDZ7956176.1 hypothetical protein [Nostoc sp. DedQUE09]MDZ8086230.1 hypothetical protein [Nostoc sp. DedQUE12b]